MGMTIEEAKEFLIDECDANIIAIDIINKYQKIQEIVKEWRESGLLQDKFYDLINEVLKDGNDK